MTENFVGQVTAYKRTLQSVVSIIMLTLLVWFVEPAKLLQQISGAPFEKIIPWSITYEILVVLAWSAGVYAMLRRFDGVKYTALAYTGFKLQVLSMIIPGRLGDISLIYFLKDQLNKDESTAVLLVDKLITLSVIAALATIGIDYFYGHIYALASVAAIAVCLSFFVLLVFYKKQRNGSKCLSRVPFASFLSGMRQQLVITLKDINAIARNLLFTLSRMLLAGFSFTLILSWFGADVALWYVILVQALVQLTTIIPITYMGIGLVEAINIYLLGMAGVEASIILAASLTARSVQIAFYLLISAFWLNPFTAGKNKT